MREVVKTPIQNPTWHAFGPILSNSSARPPKKLSKVQPIHLSLSLVQRAKKKIVKFELSRQISMQLSYILDKPNPYSAQKETVNLLGRQKSYQRNYFQIVGTVLDHCTNAQLKINVACFVFVGACKGNNVATTNTNQTMTS